MLLALTISPGKAILVAALYVLAHQIEGNVIQPLGVARAVKMHPAAVAVGVIAVDRLFGVVGLIVSVPSLVTATIFIDELWTKPIEQNHAIVATGRDEHTAAELVPITSATAARHID